MEAMMSIFNAIQSVNPTGRVSIMTNKPYYVSGEKVTGFIQAQVNQPINARAIVLQVVGHEKAEWHTQESRQELIREATQNQPAEYRTIHFVRRHRGKKEFFNQTLQLYQINGQLMPGNYTFPFEYQLPDGLPGSFFERRDRHFTVNEFHDDDQFEDKNYYDSDDEVVWQGRGYTRSELNALIMYKLKVTLDVNGFFSRDLHAKLPMIVHEKLALDVAPAFGKTEGTVCLCCCIPRGKVFLEAHFDKNAYAPGETAQIMAMIDNQSSSKITMAVKLMRFLTLKTGGWGGRAQTWTDTVCEQKYDVVEPKTTAKRPLPLPLVGPRVVPTTNGELVSCTYRYDVECQIDWAPDIELHMPVVIYAPQPPPQFMMQRLF